MAEQSGPYNAMTEQLLQELGIAQYAGLTHYGAYKAAIAEGNAREAFQNIKWDFWGDDRTSRHRAIESLQTLVKDHPEHAAAAHEIVKEALWVRTTPEAQADILKSSLVSQQDKDQAYLRHAHSISEGLGFRDEELALMKGIATSGVSPEIIKQAAALPKVPADIASSPITGTAAKSTTAEAPPAPASSAEHEPLPHLQHIKKTALGAINDEDKFLIAQIQTKLQTDHKDLGKYGVDGLVTSKHEPSKTVQAWNSETENDPKANSADLMAATRMAFKKLSSLQITKEQIIESKGEILSDTTRAFLTEAAKEQKKVTDVALTAIDVHPGETPAQPDSKKLQR